MTAQNGKRSVMSRPIEVACTAAQQRPRVTGRSLAGATLVLEVAVSGPGKVRVSGAGLRTTTRTVRAAGTARIRVPLSAHGARRLRATGSFASRVRVGYGRRSAITSSRTIRITLRGSRRSR
jgi:hypothetical protein